ncbi:MAG: hypothetical protein WC760_04125 [Bacteroidia bacterium]|jgi:hypothetical protein
MKHEAEKIKGFEELYCWQQARELVKQFFSICYEQKLSRDFVTQQQLKRSTSYQ